ncbi:amidohydrolase/deacetylase family metallohydrolase [Daejeonella sp. JGW-45]|uniref:amidohydrolase/deacetylase family metallohydrolase n=1 Tax=Daejeonella sp. JGW-45 TaxID=3034148 RepID=UPI0023ED65C1|nr:amidohydrolase/deacetylase family metallohydrolase [Daejeonella sp. JGW-45]
MKQKILLLSVLLMLGLGASAQPQQRPSGKPYAYIIKGGHVIDPKNNINEVMDVAITAGTRGMPARPAIPARPAEGNRPARPALPAREAVPAVEGKVALVAKNISADQADRIIDAKGLYVTPGLIDLHVHFFWGHDGSYLKDAATALPADGFTFRTGVTTVVDAGCTGWRDFELYKKRTIDASQTRVLTMLNIVGTGMDGRGENNIDEMDPVKTAEMAKKYPKDIVGVKLAHFSGRTWVPTDRALEAGRLANIPIMVDFGSADPYLPLDSLFNVKFRPGDIYTHAFGGNGTDSPDGRESIVDMNGKVKPYVYKARDRGIVFDIGFGGASYLYNQGVPAIKQGFYPTTISTDLHTGSMNGPMKSMENIMGLFMATGMPLKDVITASTWNPAKAIKREELGNLSVGSVADIAIFKVNEGNYGWPVRGGKIAGKQRLQTEMTIRAGNIVYDLDGIGQPVGPTPAAAAAGR